MIDDRFDDVLKETAKEYNEPPETPRALMWARIDAVRRERALRRPQLRILYSPWTRFGVGIAAALAIGIGIGRFALAPDAIEPIAITSNGDAPAVERANRRGFSRLSICSFRAVLASVARFITSQRGIHRRDSGDRTE